MKILTSAIFVAAGFLALIPAHNSSQFTVAWEERDNGEWKPRDTYICHRSSHRDDREQFRSYYRHC